MSCSNGTPTTLTGKVYAPNGTLPLYNAIVYIPSQTPAAFTDGVTCGACDSTVSGNPIVTALTDATGSFTLTNVPPGDNIPLVIQMGKWRKQTTISVPACASTAVDIGSTTLPKNSSEGDMPKMAIATGSADPFECLLLKIGIDPAEIQPDSAGKRLAFFTGTHAAGTTMNGATAGTALYPSLAKLMTYDIVMLPCEGGEYDQSTSSGGIFGGGTPLSPDPRGLIAQYVNMGGRLFTTHYSYDWLTYANSPFNSISKPLASTGLWPADQSDYPGDDTQSTTVQLVTNFPKGMAFAQWLIAAGATSAPNTLDILAIRHDIDSVDPALAQSWATDTMPDGPGIAHLTFNTPLDPSATIDNPGMYCGRVVYSDFHVASNEVTGTKFPSACVAGPMTDQEKALAFMLFDLSSCVQPDGNVPVPPIT